jgi:hypothetical protein
MDVAPRAVAIPPRGPAPGQRSGRMGQAKCVYRSCGATIETETTCGWASRAARVTIGTPPNSSKTLSCPMRSLEPPARTNAATLWNRFTGGFCAFSNPCRIARTPNYNGITIDDGFSGARPDRVVSLYPCERESWGDPAHGSLRPDWRFARLLGRMNSAHSSNTDPAIFSVFTPART